MKIDAIIGMCHSLNSNKEFYINSICCGRQVLDEIKAEISLSLGIELPSEVSRFNYRGYTFTEAEGYGVNRIDIQLEKNLTTWWADQGKG